MTGVERSRGCAHANTQEGCGGSAVHAANVGPANKLHTLAESVNRRRLCKGCCIGCSRRFSSRPAGIDVDDQADRGTAKRRAMCQSRVVCERPGARAAGRGRRRMGGGSCGRGHTRRGGRVGRRMANRGRRCGDGGASIRSGALKGKRVAQSCCRASGLRRQRNGTATAGRQHRWTQSRGCIWRAPAGRDNAVCPQSRG